MIGRDGQYGFGGIGEGRRRSQVDWIVASVVPGVGYSRGGGMRSFCDYAVVGQSAQRAGLDFAEENGAVAATGG